MPRQTKRRKPANESPCAYIKRKYSYWTRMIAKTKSTGMEHAYSICMPAKGIDFIMGECRGTTCSVAPVECPDNAPRAVNHTHPGDRPGHTDFSIADLASGLVSGAPFDCLYSVGDRRGICITYRPQLDAKTRQLVLDCRTLERHKRGSKKIWAGLEQCYKILPPAVGQSFCEYSLRTRAKKINYQNEE